MQYRRITADDVEEVTDFALHALRRVAAGLPLHVEPGKVRAAVSFFASASVGHFQMAAFDGKRCVAAMAVFVAELPFFERSEGHIYFCFASRPGTALPILRAMRAWFDKAIHIRRLSWAFNEMPGDERDRMLRLLNRLGFNRRLDLLVAYKE